MKHSDSTEMDRLLRRHARRSGETLPAMDDSPDGGTGGAHMDADEMGAYAEGALPAAARSRYVLHLADCDACRKIVTSLTLATGAAAKEREPSAIADASPSQSWREWLAALFSPPVLRYGVPALALLAVIVVAFIATRMQRDGQFTARNENTTQARPPAGAQSANTSGSITTDAIAENHSNSNVITPEERQQAASPGSATTATTSPVQTAPADSPSAPQTGTSQTADQAPGAAAREQEGVLARKDDAASKPAAAPPPPPAATPAPEIGDLKDKQAGQKRAAERDEEKVANQPAPSIAGATQSQTEIGEDANTVAKSEARSERTNRARRPVSGAAKAGVPATQNERAVETRQVAGRHFRRQGNSWVDTTYKASRSLTNVARGSEQYRALVADEPGLRTVTEQLGGEVIVVWKSRAYRFY